MTRRTLWGAAALGGALLLAQHANAASIEEAVKAAQSTPPFEHALLFVDVEDDAGNVIYEQNAHTLMIPASVRKLFSMATVSDCLPPDAKLHTELWLDGNDVIIKGDGDPSFGADRYAYDDRNTFAPFIDALKARGVVKVHDLIADVSLYDRVTIPYQWKVGNLTDSDAAPVDALEYRENSIDGAAVADGGFYALINFRNQLEFAGIHVDGALRLQTERRAWDVKLASIASPYLEQLLLTTLRVSQNLYAETLYKRISAAEKPASYSGSRSIESDFLTQEVGIDSTEFRLVDGCGLAPDDLATPAAIVKLLRWMNDPARRPFWWTVLAQPGDAEGTLRRRLVPLADRLRGKTGTVAGVNSLAGIVASRDGNHFRYFAIAFNHHLGAQATKLIDAIVDSAADF